MPNDNSDYLQQKITTDSGWWLPKLVMIPKLLAYGMRVDRTRPNINKWAALHPPTTQQEIKNQKKVKQKTKGRLLQSLKEVQPRYFSHNRNTHRIDGQGHDHEHAP